MNYLKKKIKAPIGLNNVNNNNKDNKDLEDDLYDEYVVEAPPHPSELIALGVNPDEIDINDPDKLRELYRQAKEEGKDKKVNSVLLAKQRQKEEIEEKKKTREEWKFFDNLTARVEQTLKESQKTLDQLKETSTIDKLTEPEYELRLTADQLFKSSATAEKSANNWIDFDEGCGLKMSEGQKEVSEDSNAEQGDGSKGDLKKDTNQFGGDGRRAEKRLYHRNMSSFEAASLHLEQQQQIQQNVSLLNEMIDSSQAQSDLIAKMTADFQTAIETNDKEFVSADNINTNPFENFDPFETIVDDDISFPSPTGQDNNNNNKSQTTNDKNNDHGGYFNPFETVVDRDALSSPPPPPTDVDSLEPNSAVDFLDSAPPISKVPNPTPIHQPHPMADEEQECRSEEAASNKATPMNLKEGSTSIESVIENVKHEQRDGLKEGELPAQEDVSAECKETTLDKTQASARFRGPPETAALPRPKPPARPQQQGPELQPLLATVPKTPAKKAQQPKKKRHEGDEDSSDSSDDDDRIRILIRAREPVKPVEGDTDEDGTKIAMPLLPPPPSRTMLMQQVREKGRLDDSNSTRVVETRQKIDSFEDLPIGEKEKRDSSDNNSSDNKKDDDNDKLEEGATKGGQYGDGDEDEEEEEEEEELNETKQFVIPMTLSDDDADYEKPETPLFDDDTSYALEDFPSKYEGPGWDMMLRYPPKKKLTTNRFWKKIFVKLAQVPENTSNNNSKTTKLTTTQASEQNGGTCVVLQIYDKREDKKPMQEIPIQATYTVSEINSQQFDQFGKIFTIRLDYIFYKERFGVRQGQLARFIHTGHIGSSTTSGGHGVDPISIGAIKRIGAPIEHSPQSSQIIKLGCSSYNDIREFKNCLEDFLFNIPILRDRALSTYKTEEVQMAVRDETYLELNQIGQITKQLARVRLFFLSFLNGMPYIEVGINDIHRQGREVVGRMDILPVVTEEWIRLESCELHSTVDMNEFENPDLRIIKLTPPDATFFELMRFRVRPPRNRELPLQITANMSVTRTKVSINCDVMVPGCVSRKHGQIPCENIAIRIQIPDCWIYFFREEKHFRMGSKKSVNRRAGKVKGIERFLGGGGLQDINDQSSLIEVTSGQAKYEHHHNAIVWRAPRWPKDNQSAYVQNTMKIRLPLTAYDKMPDSFYEYVHVEYTMPATTVSHTTLRSISVNPCDEEPPEKYVRYSAKYEYKVKMRLSVNTKPGGGASVNAIPENSPIVIMKQPDLQGDLQREEDINSDSESE